MTPVVFRVPAEDWVRGFATEAHRCAFGVVKAPDFEKVDYALLVVDQDKDQPVGYVTVREINSDIAMWKFGGAFEPIFRSVNVHKAYKAGLEEMRKLGFKHLITLIVNENLPAMKLAMAHGFRIIGTKTFAGEILVELCLTFKE